MEYFILIEALLRFNLTLVSNFQYVSCKTIDNHSETFFNVMYDKNFVWNFLDDSDNCFCRNIGFTDQCRIV